MNVQQRVLHAQPKSEAERAEVAAACRLDLRIEMPMLLDELSNEVDAAWAALPERLYLVDSGGRVAYRGGPGPFAFDPDAWERAIVEHLRAGGSR
jgi:hypothetical protein